MDILKKIASADIQNNIDKGLVNEINLIDEDCHITDVAKIYKNPLDNTCRVSLSSAYCQFLWLICDIFLKEIDLSIIKEVCDESKMSLKDCRSTVKCLLQNLAKINIKILQEYPCIDSIQCIDYLQRVLQLLDKKHEEQQKKELNLALSLIDKQQAIDTEELGQLNLDGLYEQLTNSVYCFGIAFVLLHELSHFALGHLNIQDEKLEDEENADFSAFWAIYSDITEKERFSANTGILCALFSQMMLNPHLEEDNVHPREDKRLFAIYEKSKSDNSKYSVLLKKLFDFWGVMSKIKGCPMGLPDTEESLYKIREFIDEDSWK